MPFNNPNNEGELLLRIAQGDQSAYRSLVNRVNGKITTFVITHIGLKHPGLIEEIVCDVLLQVWLAREVLPGLNDFDSYLFILARNKGLDALKKELREQNRRRFWAETAVASEEKERLLAENHALTLIDQAVAELPPQQQKVWILSRKRSLTYVQISAELDISRETVKSYLQAANQAIKQFVINRMKDFPEVIFLLFVFFL